MNFVIFPVKSQNARKHAAGPIQPKHYMPGSQDVSIKNSRRTIPVLVACHKGAVSAPLRHALSQIGFGKIASRNTYELAIEEARLERFTFVFFDAIEPEGSPISSIDFLQTMIEIQSRETIMIGVSVKPTAENIFKVIRHGARGYVIPPFTPVSAEGVLLRATEDPKIDPAVLAAADRNVALARMVLDNLDRLSSYMKRIERQLASDDEPSLEAIIGIDRHSVLLLQSVVAARKFCQDGEQALLNAFMEETISRALGKSKLRLSRHSHKRQRGH